MGLYAILYALSLQKRFSVYQTNACRDLRLLQPILAVDCCP